MGSVFTAVSFMDVDAGRDASALTGHHVEWLVIFQWFQQASAFLKVFFLSAVFWR